MSTPAGAAVRHQYSYLLCDLRTDTLLAELPLRGVTYSTALSGIGTLRATVPYSDETLPLDPDAATVPGRTALYVERDGVIVWGGIVWARTTAKGGRDVQAAEFPSYYQRRYVKTTLSTDTTKITDTDYVPDGQRLYPDQKHIAWSLLRYAHAQAGGDIGVDITALAGTGHGITRSVTYEAQERTEIYKAISDLASAADGFDWGIEVGWTNPTNGSAPTRYRRAVTYYPRRGRTAAESGLVFVHGGHASSIVDYEWPEDGTALATEVSGLGDGSGSAVLQSVAQHTDMLASGWPLLESVSRWDGVKTAGRLASLTEAELAARSQAQVQPRFTVSADTDPQFGSYSVGDEALFIVEPSTQMPGGREAVLRIVGIENSARSGPERVSLTCAAV
jgi:hypothetical protein